MAPPTDSMEVTDGERKRPENLADIAHGQLLLKKNDHQISLRTGLWCVERWNTSAEVAVNDDFFALDVMDLNPP